MATSEASVMMHAGAFCSGCTRRVALARAFLIFAKAAVLASSQARVAFPFVAARSACIEGFENGRTTRDESQMGLHGPGIAL